MDQRRAGFQQVQKRTSRERGKAVLPVRDVPRHGDELDVVTTIIALAVIWKWTLPDQHDARSPAARPALRRAGRPGTTNFVPRPDWYFYFLFYLLRIFKWPESVILGTVGIPTIC
jgi:quinol-cytochrome oxidoreductase complex cytochrome b subunit